MVEAKNLFELALSELYYTTFRAFADLALQFKGYVLIKFGSPDRIFRITDTTPHFSRKVFSSGFDH